MKKAWRAILVIVIICLAFGAVSAGVGLLTGADPARISAAMQTHIAEHYDVDADLFIHEWVPEVAHNIQGALS